MCLLRRAPTSRMYNEMKGWLELYGIVGVLFVIVMNVSLYTSATSRYTCMTVTMVILLRITLYLVYSTILFLFLSVYDFIAM